MDNDKRSKINRLLTLTPKGIVLTSQWLAGQGYSLELQKRYKKSQWFESIGSGAMIRNGEKVGFEGAIYAMQHQLDFSFHPAGRTALTMLGKAHYLEFGVSKVYIFGLAGEQLPIWFKQKDWGHEFSIKKTNFLPSNTGLVDFEVKDFQIKISGSARAMLECIYLTPKEHSIQECFELMEGLNNLRPKSVQELLENCTSVKVKRLFLYLAEKAGHSWLKHIQFDKVDLGKGKRSLVKNGAYISKYQITVPKELEENATARI